MSEFSIESELRIARQKETFLRILDPLSLEARQAHVADMLLAVGYADELLEARRLLADANYVAVELCSARKVATDA